MDANARLDRGLSAMSVLRTSGDHQATNGRPCCLLSRQNLALASVFWDWFRVNRPRCAQDTCPLARVRLHLSLRGRSRDQGAVLPWSASSHLQPEESTACRLPPPTPKTGTPTHKEHQGRVGTKAHAEVSQWQQRAVWVHRWPRGKRGVP